MRRARPIRSTSRSIPIAVSPEAYNDVIDTYKNPFVGLLEVGLVGAILFHAFNGLRVMLIDFWAKGARYQRQMVIGVGGSGSCSSCRSSCGT